MTEKEVRFSLIMGFPLVTAPKRSYKKHLHDWPRRHTPLSDSGPTHHTMFKERVLLTLYNGRIVHSIHALVLINEHIVSYDLFVFLLKLLGRQIQGSQSSVTSRPSHTSNKLLSRTQRYERASICISYHDLTIGWIPEMETFIQKHIFFANIWSQICSIVKNGLYTTI